MDQPEKIVVCQIQLAKGFWRVFLRNITGGYIIKYINNQKQHHQMVDFINEYLDILNKFNVDFDPKYIFSPIE